jgi:predicted RNase H-like nuclease
MFDDAAPIWAFKFALNAIEDPEQARIAPSGSFIAEVFPALALPTFGERFCGRLMGPKYNPSRRKTFRLDHWHAVLACTAAAGDALGINGLADWCERHGNNAAPTKSDQDLLDGVLCALIGFVWLFEPRSRSLMIGDLEAGYMIAPATGEAQTRLIHAAAGKGVPCK